MTGREKLIELLDEAEEHSTDICVYSSDCKDCPGGKYGNKCRDYLKADYLISHGVTVRERGRWTLQRYYGGLRKGMVARVICSECGYPNEKTNYCPSCGADMR